MTSIYVDFHNTTPTGRVRLNTIGSIKDLNNEGVALREGLPLRLYSEDFEVLGIVEFANEERMWVASFNWDDVRCAKPLTPTTSPD